jgi:predicted ribosomally synthesized peptide with SipW-like signal peptide
MRKLFLSLAVVGITSAIAIGATSAYFSDTETSSANTFTAGTLDLAIDGQNGSQVTTKYTLTNWYPGKSSMVGGFTVKNTGTVSGKFWMEIKNVVNNENGVSLVEANAGDTTTGATEGELGQFISGYFQENVGPNWYHLNPSISSLNSIVGTHLIPADGGVLNPGQEIPIVFYTNWVPTATDNVAQGDSVSFDLVFHLDQN